MLAYTDLEDEEKFERKGHKDDRFDQEALIQSSFNGLNGTSIQNPNMDVSTDGFMTQKYLFKTNLKGSSMDVFGR